MAASMPARLRAPVSASCSARRRTSLSTSLRSVMSYSTPSMTPPGIASGATLSVAGFASCTDSRQWAQRMRPSVDRSSRSADIVSLRSDACSIIARARSGRAKTRSRKSWPRSWRRSRTPPPITLSTVGLPLIRRPCRSSTKMPALVESKIWRYCASMASMSWRSSRSRGERLGVGAERGRWPTAPACRSRRARGRAARRRRSMLPGGIVASARARRTMGRETMRAPMQVDGHRDQRGLAHHQQRHQPGLAPGGVLQLVGVDLDAHRADRLARVERRLQRLAHDRFGGGDGLGGRRALQQGLAAGVDDVDLAHERIARDAFDDLAHQRRVVGIDGDGRGLLDGGLHAGDGLVRRGVRAPFAQPVGERAGDQREQRRRRQRAGQEAVLQSRTGQVHFALFNTRTTRRPLSAAGSCST